jgi:hypothetical protein
VKKRLFFFEKKNQKTRAMTDEANSLSGIWHGQYSYPVAKQPTPFVATLLDAGGALSGSITEKSTLPPRVGEALYAVVRGTRDGAAVTFQKSYEGDDPRYQIVAYEGLVSGDGTEIEGTWRTGGWQGKFLMIRGAPATASLSRGILEPTR